MSSTTATRHQAWSASGSAGQDPNRGGGGDGNRRAPYGGKKAGRVEAIRCKLCLRPGHKEGDCPSRAGPANAQANPAPHPRPRQEVNARVRRRLRRQEEHQQQQQEQEQQEQHQLGEVEEMRAEIEQLREENRQLHLELLDLRLQLSQQVEEGEDEGDEDEQYP